MPVYQKELVIIQVGYLVRSQFWLHTFFNYQSHPCSLTFRYFMADSNIDSPVFSSLFSFFETFSRLQQNYLEPLRKMFEFIQYFFPDFISNLTFLKQLGFFEPGTVISCHLQVIYKEMISN